MKNMEISEVEEKKTEKKKRIKTWMIITPFLFLSIPIAFFVTLLITGQTLSHAIEYNINTPEVKGVTFESYTYSFSAEVPDALKSKVVEGLESVEYEGIKRFILTDADADLLFTTLDEDESSKIVLLSGKLLLVTDYYSIEDSISNPQINEKVIFALEDDKDLVNVIITDLKVDQSNVQYLETYDQMITSLGTNPNSIGLIDPQSLDSRVKLMSYEGMYYLDSPSSGYLSASIGVQQQNEGLDYIVNTLPNHFKVDEKEEFTLSDDQILKLRMTGVTAISRNLAIKIINSGDPGYAAGLIGDFLADADLTHTSNEVSFVPGCVPEQSLRFCTDIAHYENLKRSGIDIVELTGNHNNDYGSQYNAETIEFYKKEGLQYFGGGLNAEDASEILYIDQDGTRVAMLGYNWFDSVLNTGAIASEARPGANRYSSEILKADIAEAKENADVVIVDFQFEECYSYPESGGLYPYCYKPLAAPDQRSVFKEAVDFGADIVVGTQAHQPQTYEVYKGKLIFYGLGNIFFDQISWIGTRQGLVITHYFVDGRHIQTKIDTTIYDSDMRPYLTSGEDKNFLLNLLNDAR